MNTIESIIEDGRQYWTISKLAQTVNFQLAYYKLKTRVNGDLDTLAAG